MNNPWGEGTPWKNSSAFFNYLRGCLRKAWSTNPIKHDLIKKKRYQIPNPNPKGKKPTVWGFDCEMCNNTFVLKECQVDHKIPAGSLQKKEDIQGFVERLLFVTENDLRLVCKGCNSALAYSDKHGITYEDAVIEKKAIEFSKKKVNEQKEILLAHNPKAKVGNAEVRKEEYRKLIKEGKV